jgi:UDPglucose 6-dehydrogenase
MTIQSIGIAGMGFVGGAVFAGFDGFFHLKRFDIDPAKCDSLAETLACDAVFVCLPTPMNAKTGECDLSIITDFLERAKIVLERGEHRPIFIIKSTVPVGTTEKLTQWAPWSRFVHNPEFLTEKNAQADFKNQTTIILGGSDQAALDDVAMMYNVRFGNRPVRMMPSGASEMVKHLINGFLALKVAWFNEGKVWANSQGLPWDPIQAAVASDLRIGMSHAQVPGPDGMHGFGGKCLPKDLSSMISQFIQSGLDPSLPLAVSLRNRAVREKADWEEIPWAVTKDKE